MNADKLYNTVAQIIEIQPKPLFVTNKETWNEEDAIRRLLGWDIKPAQNQTLDDREVLSYTVCNIVTLKKSFNKEVIAEGIKLFPKGGQLLIIGVKE